MIELQKVEKTVNHEGTTITYKGTRDDGLVVYIQSRQRNIPHANRGGTWIQTTYYIIYNNGLNEKRFWSRKEAVEWADKEWRD